jgi:excisionase family DNA binding protein
MTNRTDDIKDLKLYTLTELEEIVGVTHRTLLSYVKDGKLKAVKVGSKWKVSRADLLSFIGA